MAEDLNWDALRQKALDQQEAEKARLAAKPKPPVPVAKPVERVKPDIDALVEAELPKVYGRIAKGQAAGELYAPWEYYPMGIQGNAEREAFLLKLNAQLPPPFRAIHETTAWENQEGFYLRWS